MDQYVAALVGGGFGLVVAVVTWSLAMLRERHVFARTQSTERRNKLESLYADEISLMEKALGVTACRQ